MSLLRPFALYRESHSCPLLVKIRQVFLFGLWQWVWHSQLEITLCVQNKLWEGTAIAIFAIFVLTNSYSNPYPPTPLISQLPNRVNWPVVLRGWQQCPTEQIPISSSRCGGERSQTANIMPTYATACQSVMDKMAKHLTLPAFTVISAAHLLQHASNHL